MHVRVVEAGHDAAARGVDDARVGTAPAIDLIGAADIHDPIGDDRHAVGRGPRAISGPDLRVDDHEVRGRVRLTAAGSRQTDGRERHHPDRGV